MREFAKKIDDMRKLSPNAFLDEIRILMKKKWRKINLKWRRFIIPIFPIKLSDREFLKALRYNDKSTISFLKYMRKRNRSIFFFRPEDKDNSVKIIKREYPKSIGRTIKDADKICNHVFELLGSGKTYLGEKIEWHYDFKSEFRWNPKTYYLGTRKHVTLDDDSDVKVPWELSRCQHFVSLGKAYWYASDEKYAKEFVSEIENWIDQNPVELGVNWTSPMEAAIRAVNWIWGYYFFYDSKTLTKDFQVRFLKTLFLHGRFIAKHGTPIENTLRSEIRGNHYLSEIVGLIYLGIFFPACHETKQWLERGLSALENEIKFQVHQDGVDFEGAISYHRLVTELFLSATLLSKRNKIDVPQEIMRMLEKMFEFTMYYTKPNGMCPMIGDADDGRLHILSKNDINDHRYLLSTGAVLFKRGDFKTFYNVFNEEAFWLLGIGGLNEFKKLPVKKFEVKSREFKEGGFYIMRNGHLYMIIDCGDVGLKGQGGHGHNDTLSFEMFVYDKSFIIDPGAYIYTGAPKWRNMFRSTKFHNTIVVDNEEMNRFEKNNLFIMEFDAIPKVHKWEVTDKYDFFDGEHSGYKRLNDPVIHRRKILFNKSEGYWIIKDVLSGKGKHRFDLFFHFAPIKIELNREYPLIVESKIKGEANIMIIPMETKGVSIELMDGWISYSYGKKVKAPVLRYSKVATLPTCFVSVVYPYNKPVTIKEVIKKIQKDLDKRLL